MRETKRQIMHIFSGMVLAALIYFKILDATRLFILLVLGLVLSLIVRHHRLPVISWMLDHMEREGNHILPGLSTLHYLAGCIIVLLLFPMNIALASIMILTFGDSCSHLGGKYLGRTKTRLNDRKLMEGTVIGIVVGALAAGLFVEFMVAFVGSFFAMLIEVLEIKLWGKIIDDNITVPVVAGIAMWIITHVA